MRRQHQDVEQTTRFEGKDLIVTLGGRVEFQLMPRGAGVACRTCKASKRASGPALRAFYDEHYKLHAPELPAEPPETVDLEQLVERVRALEGDEREVLALVVDGLERGRPVYGQLDVAGDKRDFEAEALQEVRDAAIYAAAGIVRRRRQLRAKGTP